MARAEELTHAQEAAKTSPQGDGDDGLNDQSLGDLVTEGINVGRFRVVALASGPAAPTAWLHETFGRLTNPVIVVMERRP